MDIEGKIIQDLGEQSGTSRAGNLWRKKEWVLETFGAYPKKVKFHVFGDRIDTMNILVGNDYTLSFDLESREYNGRWYTDVSVYKAQPLVAGQNAQGATPGGFAGQPQGGFPGSAEPISPFGGINGTDVMSSPFGGDEGGEDLPF